MIRIFLSEEERIALNRLRRSQKSNIGERAYYVLLCGEGKSVSETAKTSGCDEHTIRLWLKRYITYGITGLKSRGQPGRPARKAPNLQILHPRLRKKRESVRSLRRLGKRVERGLKYFSRMNLIFQTNLMSVEVGLKVVKKSSQYGESQTEQDYFWRIKHANKPILLEAG